MKSVNNIPLREQQIELQKRSIKDRTTVPILIFIGIPLLYFVAGSIDFSDYSDFISEVRSQGWNAVESSRFEPLFGILVFATINIASNNAIVFSLLALSSLAFKLHCISLASNKQSLAIFCSLFYVVRIFPLHEMTQLRIALALGFTFGAVVWWRRAFWICTAAALATHYSTAMLIPLLLFWRFLKTAPHAYKSVEFLTWFALIAVATGVATTADYILDFLTQILPIIDLYSKTTFGDDQVNLFSAPVLLDLVFILSVIPFFRRSTELLRFWLFIQIMGLLIFFCIRSFPIIAHRTREMFDVFLVFYFCEAENNSAILQLHARLFLFANISLYLFLNFFSSYALVKF